MEEGCSHKGAATRSKSDSEKADIGLEWSQATSLVFTTFCCHSASG